MYLAASRIPKNTFETFFQCETINVLSLGGGPRSDIVAIKQKLIDKNDNEIKIDVNILRIDIVSDWNPIALDIINIQKDTAITFNHFKRNCNLVKDVLPKKGHNLITMSYLISEVDFDDIPCLISNIKNSLAEIAVIFN
jgi:hypothetical protein